MKVQPIPNIRHQMYCVNELFVEGGMKVLTSNEIIREANETIEDYTERKERWGVKSTRRILEGAPGYGKSTVALQLAYDWCKGGEVDASNADILILLRLRQLKGISSIFKTYFPNPRPS
ncbi:hypothetical protein HOLleu_00991 [Holothuria leucospilota]|uniref:Uncharacterized protein n=1 Tax=Holothuria leucospilota TaxID=206669 RepID=A0A9Q1HKN9_HOLLE|nr:hypothetical protein HOLleu_00991 [Holothuria leucospilota]